MQIRVALLLWQFRRELAVLAIALLCLLLLGLSLLAALFTLPFAGDDVINHYRKAVQELKDQRNLTLDYRWPLAIDAVRRNQNFDGVSAGTARDTVKLFVKEELREVACPPQQIGPCFTIVYFLKSPDEVMSELAFEPWQREMAQTIAAADVSPSGACLGFQPNPQAAFAWPLPGGVLTSCFGPRVDPVSGGPDDHTGIDLAGPHGAQVVAAQAGTVSYAGTLGDYGDVVVVSHGGGVWTWYAHLSAYAVFLGQDVARGQVVGYVGSTGKSTGPHLHFEVRAPAPVDPLTYYR